MSTVFELDPASGNMSTHEGAPFDPMACIAQSADRIADAFEVGVETLGRIADALQPSKPPEPSAEALRQGNEALMKFRAEIEASKHDTNIAGIMIKVDPKIILDAIDLDGPHGWVRPLPNGDVAKCGGPQMCKQCRREHDAVTARAAGEVLEIAV